MFKTCAVALFGVIFAIEACSAQETTGIKDCTLIPSQREQAACFQEHVKTLVEELKKVRSEIIIPPRQEAGCFQKTGSGHADVFFRKEFKSTPGVTVTLQKEIQQNPPHLPEVEILLVGVRLDKFTFYSRNLREGQAPQHVVCFVAAEKTDFRGPDIRPLP